MVVGISLPLRERLADCAWFVSPVVYERSNEEIVCELRLHYA